MSSPITPALSAEQWRPVLGYEGLYEASSFGAIRRIAGLDSRGWRRRQRVLRSALHSTGYLCVALSKNGQMRTFRVHTLVARAFFGPRPDGYEANHRSGEKRDNSTGNIEYITAEANQRHAVENGLKASGERNGSAFLSADDVAAIRALRKRGVSRVEVARRFGIKHADYITRITSGKVWT